MGSDLIVFFPPISGQYLTVIVVKISLLSS